MVELYEDTKGNKWFKVLRGEAKYMYETMDETDSASILIPYDYEWRDD